MAIYFVVLSLTASRGECALAELVYDVVCKADRQYGPDYSQLILTDIFYSINDFVPDSWCQHG